MAYRNDIRYILFNKIIEAVDKVDIEYVIMGNPNDELLQIEKDFDVFCPIGFSEFIVRKIVNVSTTVGWSVIKDNSSARIASRFEGKYIIANNDDHELLLQIDVWEIYHWRGFPIISYEELHKYPIEIVGGKKYCHEEIAIGFSLIKDVLLKEGLPQHHLMQIKGIRPKRSLNLAYRFLFDLLPSRLAEGLIRVIEDPNSKGVNKLSDSFRFHLVYRSLKGNFSKQLINCFRYLLSIIQSYQRNRHIILALEGPDGAGKTSIVVNISQWSVVSEVFNECNIFHTNFSLLPPIKKLIPFNKKICKAKNNLHSRQLEPSSLVRSILRPVYYAINNVLANTLWSIKRSRKSNLYLFDRYYYEYLIQLEYSRCPRFLLYILSRIVPRPDILVILTGEAKVIHRRKDELPEQEIKRQIESLKNLHRYSRKTIILDTTDIGVDQTSKIILLELLKLIEFKISL